MEGLIPEAIRKMENLRSKHDVELGVAMALLYFHGKAQIVDRCDGRHSTILLTSIIESDVKQDRYCSSSRPSIPYLIALDYEMSKLTIMLPSH